MLVPAKGRRNGARRARCRRSAVELALRSAAIVTPARGPGSARTWQAHADALLRESDGRRRQRRAAVEAAERACAPQRAAVPQRVAPRTPRGARAVSRGSLTVRLGEQRSSEYADRTRELVP